MGCRMKDCARCIGLLGVGLLTATVAYPLLHEAGHAVTAIMVGARVTAFQLFPVPFVVCDVSEIGGVAQAVIGIGGIAGTEKDDKSLTQQWVACGGTRKMISWMYHIQGGKEYENGRCYTGTQNEKKALTGGAC